MSSNFIVLNSKNCGSQPQHIQSAFDQLGVESGLVQSLSGPITSIEKLGSSVDNVAVVLIMHDLPAGYAKFGYKNLYFYTKHGQVVERPNTPCLLDFYVSESMQRTGIGKSLFEKALEVFSISDPRSVAYDRPSNKLVPFLAKHYQLVNGDLQPNRYMIFDGFLT